VCGRYDDPAAHPDFADLNKALELVSESAKHNNEMIRQRENMDALLAVQNSFVDGTKLNLLDTNGRTFLKKGKLTKLSRKGPQRHTFWLFSDILVYGDKNKALGLYRVNRVIPLLKCQISSPSKEEIEKMQVSWRGGERSGCELLRVLGGRSAATRPRIACPHAPDQRIAALCE